MIPRCAMIASWPADAIKFRDRVLHDIVPQDVATALMHRTRLSVEKRQSYAGLALEDGDKVRGERGLEHTGEPGGARQWLEREMSRLRIT